MLRAMGRNVPALLRKALAGHGRLVFAALDLMIPPTVILVPQFILFTQFGWVNTYLPLTVPHFFGNAFFIFLFRQYFRGLSGELFESAEIDGCNPWQAYASIALPLWGLVFGAALLSWALAESWSRIVWRNRGGGTA